MKEHNIDQLFRQKLQQHSELPSPAAWNQVASKLNSRRRKRGGYYAAAAAIVLLLSVGWIGLRQWNDGDEPATLQPHTSVAVHDPAAPLNPSTLPVGAGNVAEPQQQKSSKSAAAQEAPATMPDVSASTQLAVAEKAKPRSAVKTVAQQPSSEKKNAEPAAQTEDLLQTDLNTVTALARELPAAPISRQASMPLTTETGVLPRTDIVQANTEQVVITYDASEPDSNERDNAPEKVFSLMKKVKQGEIGLADIRKAKDDLLSGRFNKP